MASNPDRSPAKRRAADLLRQGIAAQQGGRPAEASRAYQAILAEDPTNADALHFLGLLLTAGAERRRGIEYMERAVDIRPAYMEAHFNLGNTHRADGNVQEAVAAFERALQLAPDDADILINLGESLRAQGRHAEALEHLRRAHQISSASTLAVYQLALTLSESGAGREAENYLRAALDREPRSLPLRELLARSLQAQGRHGAAIDAFVLAIQLAPQNAGLRTVCGESLLRVSQHAAALEAFQSALRIHPHLLEARLGLAKALYAQDRREDALAELHLARSSALEDPVARDRLAQAFYEIRAYPECLELLEGASAEGRDSASGYARRALCLRSMGRIDDACNLLEESLAYYPESADLRADLGVLRRSLGDIAGATAAFEQALAIAPSHVTARFNRALNGLLCGDLPGAWADYELRLIADSQIVPSRQDDTTRAVKRWQGREALSGKTLLLKSEQGFGDTIQFVRYAHLAAERGARVILEVQAALKGLVGSMGYPTYDAGDTLPPYDLWCPMASLPGIFGTTLDSIPRAGGYLHSTAQIEYPAPVEAGHYGPRIAVSWSGSRNAANNRPIPLALFSRLLKFENATFVMAQTEVYPEDREVLRSLAPHTLHRPDLPDFAATAALLAGVDLVITIDSALAHLAGALGRPCWLLLPFAADWRWHQGRLDSPWYLSLRIIRQPALAQWEPVIAHVEGRLLDLINRDC